MAEEGFANETSSELIVHLGATAPFSVYSTARPPLVFATPATYKWTAAETQDLQEYRRAAQEDTDRLAGGRVLTGSERALARMRGVLAEANASSARVRMASARYQPSVPYPDDELGEAFRTTAALLDARIGTRVVSLETGGFDTHSNQRTSHDRLMARLDGASMNGKSSTTPRCSDFMRKITPAKDERKISGSVKRGRPAKSLSS